MFAKKKDSETRNDPSVLQYMKSLSAPAEVKPEITFVSELCDEWLKNYSMQLQPTTVHSYRVAANCHIKRVLGHIRLDELTFEDCQLFINSLQIGCGIPTPLKTKTIRNIYEALHVALKTAVKLELIRSNPADGVLLPKNEKFTYTLLDQKKLCAFYTQLEGHSMRDLFLFDLYTGLRQAEVIGLTWDCVDLTEGTMNIHRQLQYNKDTNEYIWSPPKGGRTRLLALNKHALEILRRVRSKRRRAKGPDDFVFITRNLTHYSPTGVYKSFKTVVDHIGCPNVRFHDLRHTYAVMSLQAGIDPKTIQYNLGHYSAAFTLDVYCHCLDEMKKKGSEKLDSFFDNLLQTERSNQR